MNNPNQRPGGPLDSLEEELEFREDLEAIHRLPVPAMRFDPLSLPARTPVATIKRRWRPAALAASAAAALALFAGGTSLFGGGPDEVSAQEVFQKTHAIAAMSAPASSTESYHMVATNEGFGPPGKESAISNQTTETWYQDPEHTRSETRDQSGKLVFGNVQNGEDLWFYSTALDDDELKAVHATNGSMAYSAGVRAQDFGADSLAGLLEMYSGTCANAEKVGEETVAGRPTYVIEVTQTPETCDLKPVITKDGDLTTVQVQSPDGAGAGPGVAGSLSVQATEGGAAAEPEFRILETTTRMWVDQETFITLKSETEAEDGLLFRYEVTEFEVNPEFDSSTFEFEPPPGVEVVEADGPEDIKPALSGSGVGVSSAGGVDMGPSLESVEEGTTER